MRAGLHFGPGSDAWFTLEALRLELTALQALGELMGSEDTTVRLRAMAGHCCIGCRGTASGRLPP